MISTAQIVYTWWWKRRRASGSITVTKAPLIIELIVPLLLAVLCNNTVMIGAREGGRDVKKDEVKGDDDESGDSVHVLLGRVEESVEDGSARNKYRLFCPIEHK